MCFCYRGFWVYLSTFWAPIHLAAAEGVEKHVHLSIVTCVRSDPAHANTMPVCLSTILSQRREGNNNLLHAYSSPSLLLFLHCASISLSLLPSLPLLHLSPHSPHSVLSDLFLLCFLCLVSTSFPHNTCPSSLAGTRRVNPSPGDPAHT